MSSLQVSLRAPSADRRELCHVIGYLAEFHNASPKSWGLSPKIMWTKTCKILGDFTQLSIHCQLLTSTCPGFVVPGFDGPVYDGSGFDCPGFVGSPIRRPNQQYQSTEGTNKMNDLDLCIQVAQGHVNHEPVWQTPSVTNV